MVIWRVKCNLDLALVMNFHLASKEPSRGYMACKM